MHNDERKKPCVILIIRKHVDFSRECHYFHLTSDTVDDRFHFLAKQTTKNNNQGSTTYNGQYE